MRCGSMCGRLYLHPKLFLYSTDCNSDDQLFSVVYSGFGNRKRKVSVYGWILVPVAQISILLVFYFSLLNANANYLICPCKVVKVSDGDTAHVLDQSE
jgi:hypothetical protein